MFVGSDRTVVSPPAADGDLPAVFLSAWLGSGLRKVRRRRWSGRTVAWPDRASRGSGGPAVWLDAVLAEQASQPLELAVRPLVLCDHRLHVHAGHPLPLPPQLLGKQLLFPVPER